MEYLQYINGMEVPFQKESFKPYYKWNTFNTVKEDKEVLIKKLKVLNLIINGIPSIQKLSMKVLMLMWKF